MILGVGAHLRVVDAELAGQLKQGALGGRPLEVLAAVQGIDLKVGGRVDADPLGQQRQVVSQQIRQSVVELPPVRARMNAWVGWVMAWC